MNNNRIVTIIAFVSCLAGCSIDEPPRFNGSSCGGADIPFLGILGDKSLSDKRHPTADQNGRYNLYHICPEEFPYCVYVQNGAVMDESAGVMCSSCKQGQLLCDANSGSKECTEVLHNREHCGGCGIHCDGLCINGSCLNPDSDETCGATDENPDGESCGESRECVKGKCQCKTGLTECNGNCVDLNSNESCGTSCNDMMRCNIDGGQSCDRGMCACLDGLILRESHCIDPLKNNKYCGADLRNDGESCPVAQGITCQNGVCRCPEGLLRLRNSDICIDPKSHLEYCGAIDNDGYALQTKLPCFSDQSCVDGNCICPDGYHIGARGCVKNEKDQCGAKGYANVMEPASLDYSGFKCDTECVHLSDVIDTYSYSEYDAQAYICKPVSKPEGPQCPFDFYDIYHGLNVAVGCIDHNRVMRCSEKCYTHSYSGCNGYISECQCYSGYCGYLCQELLNDDNNCGYCGNKCPEHTHCGEYLGTMNCICDDGYVFYNNICVYVKDDINNCGDYDHKCLDGEICENGECKSCTASQSICLNMCLEQYDALSEDSPLLSLAERHIQVCTMNEMICDDGFANCNSDGINLIDGCETDITTNENCGACGNICGETASCINGTCCLDAAYPSVELTSGEYQNAKCCDEEKNRKCQFQDASGRVIYRCRTACVDDEVDVTEDT